MVVPHMLQKRLPSARCAPQLGHCIGLGPPMESYRCQVSGARDRDCHLIPETWHLPVLSSRAMRFTEKACVMDAARINRAISRLASEIVERNRGAEGLVLVGIRRRGVPI